MKNIHDLIKRAQDNAERRYELLESIRGIHGDQAAAVAMAVAEFHTLMTILERLVMSATDDDTAPKSEGMRKLMCQLMRNGVLERTIFPLLETTSVPDDALEDYSKITEKLVATMHDTIAQL